MNQVIQIAENYLANEKLPYFKSTTTGKAFSDRYFDADDIISDAMGRAISVIRNPYTWEEEDLSESNIRQIVDNIINWMIKNPSYSRAGYETTKGQEVPLELANTDFENDPIEKMLEEDTTLSTDPQTRLIKEEEEREIKNIIKILEKELESYSEVLQYFLPYYDDKTVTGKTRLKGKKWSDIINGADRALGRKFTAQDVNIMIDIIQTAIDTKHPLTNLIINKLYESKKRLHRRKTPIN